MIIESIIEKFQKYFLNENSLKSIKDISYNIFLNIDNEILFYEIKKFIIFPSKENYTKSLIFRDNNFEIFLIIWDKNVKTLIHDHPKNGCFLFLLKGELNEILYRKNNIKNTKLVEGCKSYIDSSVGVHQIENLNNDYSYSLHVYSPPNFYLN